MEHCSDIHSEESRQLAEGMGKARLRGGFLSFYTRDCLSSSDINSAYSCRRLQAARSPARKNRRLCKQVVQKGESGPRDRKEGGGDESGDGKLEGWGGRGDGERSREPTKS